MLILYTKEKTSSIISTWKYMYFAFSPPEYIVVPDPFLSVNTIKLLKLSFNFYKFNIFVYVICRSLHHIALYGMFNSPDFSYIMFLDDYMDSSNSIDFILSWDSKFERILVILLPFNYSCNNESGKIKQVFDKG